MPQQMKFWELMSAFRESPEVLREVLTSSRWREPYLSHFEQFDRLVDRQDRGVLDALVPLELSREVAVKFSRRFVFNPVTRYLHAARRGEPIPPACVEMSALEVHNQFGGAAIEEVFESGSVEVTTKPAL